MKNNGESPYREVKSLRRGFAILEELARLGSARPPELAARCHIDRSSVYRLCDSLVEMGYVIRRREDGAFSLSDKVRGIAAGINQRESILAGSGKHLAALTAEIGWPSDMAMLSEGKVTIQDSTHGLSSVTFHRATILEKRSLTESALGRAILVMLTPAEIKQIAELNRTELGPDAIEADDAALTKLAGASQWLGYAWAAGTVDPNVSAIALGFRSEDHVIGAINIVFFRRVLTPEEAAKRYLGRLQECIQGIVDDL